MKNLTLSIVITMSLYSQVLFAQASKHEVYDQMIIENVDVKNKTVTIKGVVYAYEMLDEENSYYVSEAKIKNLKFLPKNRKYYVNIEYPTATDFTKKNSAGIVRYIGLIKQPF